MPGLILPHSAAAMYRAAAAGYDEMDNVAGLTWWLDASDTATITHSTGDVTSWADKVGSNNGTAAGTPRTGDSTLNSKNVIDLAAASTEYFSMSHGAVPDADEAATIFLVAYNSANKGALFWNGGSGTSGYACGVRNNNPATNMTIYYWGSDFNTSWDTTAAAWNIYTVITNGTTNRKVYQNGVQVLSNTPSVAADPGATTNYIGRGYASDEYLEGAVAEVGRYSSILSTANLNAVGSNLATKWGLSWTAIT